MPHLGFRLDGPFDGIDIIEEAKRPADPSRVGRFELIMKTPCPECGAASGKPCWWSRGSKPGPRLHAGRFVAFGKRQR